jgi:hypothetical protein
MNPLKHNTSKLLLSEMFLRNDVKIARGDSEDEVREVAARSLIGRTSAPDTSAITNAA